MFPKMLDWFLIFLIVYGKSKMIKCCKTRKHFYRILGFFKLTLITLRKKNSSEQLRKTTSLFIWEKKLIFSFTLSPISLHPLDDQSIPMESLNNILWLGIPNYTQLKNKGPIFILSLSNLCRTFEDMYRFRLEVSMIKESWNPDPQTIFVI